MTDAVSSCGFPPARSVQVRDLRHVLTALAIDAAGAPDGDAERIDQITELETLLRATSAALARLTTAFHDSHRAHQVAAGVPREQLGVGIATQIALARRVPPSWGTALHGTALALCREMPCTLNALETGKINERLAILLVQETATLAASDRAHVDAALADRFGELSDRALLAYARALGYQIDPANHVRRIRKARADRCVTARPAPDTMGYLTALLPVEDVAAVMAVLTKTAAAARAAGDARSRGQIMADSLVEHLTGHRASQHVAARVAPDPDPDVDLDPRYDTDDRRTRDAEQPASHEGDLDPRGDRPPPRPRAHRPGDVLPGYGTAHPPEADLPRPDTGPKDRPPIELQLVMSDIALFSGGTTPALLNGEPLPAWLARDLVADPDTKIRLRRLYTNPNGQLVGREQRSRAFTNGLRDLIIARDQRCTTPGCGAPIRHVDHTTGHANGAYTSYDEGRGRCEYCNYTKEAPGFRARLHRNPADPPGAPSEVQLITPTGHVYRSRTPRLLLPETDPVASERG